MNPDTPPRTDAAEDTDAGPDGTPTESGSGVGGWLERVGRFSARNPRTVAVAALLVVVVAGVVAVATVQVNVGVLLYVDDDSETARDWAAVESGYDRGNTVFVVLESNRSVTDPATVALVDRLDDRYTSIEGVSSVRSLADVARAGAGGEIPDTERGVERALDRVAAGNNATRTLAQTVHPENGTTVLLLSYGDIPPPSDSGALDLVATKDSETIEQRVTAATDAAGLPASVSATVTGASLFEHAALELMVTEVVALFAGGLLLVLGAVYLVMRRRLETGWHAFLSLGTAAAALVVMLAVMGLLGYDFSAIMLSVLPVGLGLGVDYGLQVQTRYREEREAGRTPTEAAGVAARTTGRTLLLAAGTTVVGLGSLLAAPVPPVRQFGVTASTSVVVAMALSVTLLVSLLVALDDGEEAGTTAGDGAGAVDDDTGFRWVGDAGGGATAATDGGTTHPDGRLEHAAARVVRFAGARPLVVLLVVLPAAAGGVAAYDEVETTQEMLDYWPQDLEERAEFERTTGTLGSPKTVYVLVRADDPYDPATLREVAAYQQRLSGLPEVDAVGGPVTAVTSATGGEVPPTASRVRQTLQEQSQAPLSEVTAPSHRPGELLLTLHVGDVRGAGTRELVERIEAAADGTDEDVSVAVTGKPVVNRAIIDNVTAGFGRTTLLSFSVALVVLAVVLRSLRDSLVLVLTVPAAAASLMLGAMYLLEIPWNPGTVSMASIALGVGIDYGLHVHERHRELLETGLDRAEAMAGAVRRLSRPILGSALTTMAGFGVLLVSRFPVVRNFGKTLVLVVGLSLLVTALTLPAAMFLTTTGREYGARLRALLPEGVGTVEASGLQGLSDPTPRPGDGTDRDFEGASPALTAATDLIATDADRSPELVVRARGRDLTVEDGDSLGREVRRLFVETGGAVEEAVLIHREHVRFDCEGGQFYVRGLGDNPTAVNGQPLGKGERFPLGPGDELDLSGVVTLRVQPADSIP
jgi:hydrophobe/amphiphile efflux-3 (HAE3) family protein